MARPDEPWWHWWVIALARTIKATLRYDAENGPDAPGEAVGGTVVVTPKEQDDDGGH